MLLLAVDAVTPHRLHSPPELEAHQAYRLTPYLLLASVIMLVLALITGLAALGQALSFPRSQGSYRPNIPRDLADGVYTVSLDARGHEIHARVAGPSVASTVAQLAAPLSNPDGATTRRSEQNGIASNSISTYCACDHHFDRVNGTQAIDDLAKQLGNGTWFEQQAMYARNGDVGVFVYRGTGVKRAWASAGSLRAMIKIIAASCGEGVVSAARYDTFAEGQAGAVTGLINLQDNPQPNLGGVKSCPQPTAEAKFKAS